MRCDAVLTAEEAVAVVGDGYQGPAVGEFRPGFTSCDWQGDGSNFGFTFASLNALAADERSADVQDDPGGATRRRGARPEPAHGPIMHQP